MCDDGFGHAAGGVLCWIVSSLWHFAVMEEVGWVIWRAVVSMCVRS